MPRSKRNEVAHIANMPRPAPPDGLFDGSTWFRYLAPADGVGEWVNETFLREGALLHNPDHAHLVDADVAYLWAAVENVRQMRRVVGQCEEVMIRAGGWQRARQEQQLCEWFGRVPAFLITLDAHYARECDDLQWCALVEHELYHIGQRTDEFGAPAFSKDGMPKLGIRGHDVEEFVGIVRRYGVAGGVGDTAKFVAAAQRAPEVGHADIARACGTCILRAA
ncbi:transposase [Burkholderia contaminans]|uniref:putative metallopeptidase n=1 Tax=Burkholderia contaminans TaxID=488447 RepID=UPI0014543817|nr:putative metallopeptidase [Burkholderia contaminans]VWC81145.1 transposase [Burkholderia contaminans]